MKWTYAKAEKKDLPAINALFMEMLDSIFHAPQKGYENGYADGQLERFVDGRDEWICIAVHEEQVIAYLSIEVHHEEEDYLYLDDLSVTRRFRNNGIGTTLLGYAEAYAEELGIPVLYLHVEKSNRSAFRLYQRLGYQIAKDEPHRYLMRKSK